MCAKIALKLMVKNTNSKEMNMKKILFSIIAVTFIIFSQIAAADKVIVKVPGEPVQVRQDGGAYVLVTPNTSVNATAGTYYFSAGDKRMICFTKENAHLLGVEVLTFNLSVGQTEKLYCTNNLDQFDIQTL